MNFPMSIKGVASMTLADGLKGFGNYFQSEAKTGALPLDQNSPQKVPYQLYAEQINGSAFTSPRQNNYSLWLYRILPSVVHSSYTAYHSSPLFQKQHPSDPNQLRYDTFYQPINTELSFADGLYPIAENSCSRIYLYHVNQTNSTQFFCNHDGEFLFVAQTGTIKIQTELGNLCIGPGEIAILPRGIKCQILGKNCYGYICESIAGRFELPNLGPIGANGLANPHDFIHPKAAFFNQSGQYQLISLYQNHLWQSDYHYHPLNVVAWKGNYLACQYDLRKFNVINTVSFDHPDPSIFTVLTVPSTTPGTANIDFVIFPERWMVAENTFRPPYYHKNIMSEFMGLIYGQYDAKKTGFMPGGFSIHNCMSAHGPDTHTYQNAVEKNLENERYQNTLAFMFESKEPWHITQSVHQATQKQKDYLACWQGLKPAKL